MAGPDHLAEAKRLLGRDNAAALAVARRTHAATATPEAILVLATAVRRNGLVAEAVALLEPLAKAAPNAWGVHYELGLALAANGDEASGIAALDRAAALNPQATGPRHALRDLRGGGEPIAALADPALHAAVAALTDREPLLRLGLDPDDFAAACLIAEVAGVDAIPLLERALSIAPAYRPVRVRLAEALHRAERDDEALATLLPLGDSARALRGAILMRLGREEEALTDLAAVAGERATSSLAHGHALRALGRRDEAIAAYRRALAADPTLGEAWWSIADLKTAPFGPDDIVAMEALKGLPPLAQSQVEFALGHAREDVGDYARAFAHYDTANALRRSIEPYDDAGHAAFVARMIEASDAASFPARDAAAGPIFVVGMPRSGTTLVEQILASHSRIEGLGELPKITNIARTISDYPIGLRDLSPGDLLDMGSDYLAYIRTRQRTDASLTIDKFPGNAFHIALIRLILPSARIIHVRRDPLDTCVSLFAQSFAGGQAYSYDLTDLGHHYARYDTLMRHHDGAMLTVGYEALVDDLEGQTRRMLDYLGLDFEPATQRFFDRRNAVRTASSEQVRQPIYRSAIGRWRRFERYLSPLRQALSDDR